MLDQVLSQLQEKPTVGTSGVPRIGLTRLFFAQQLHTCLESLLCFVVFENKGGFDPEASMIMNHESFWNLSCFDRYSSETLAIRPHVSSLNFNRVAKLAKRARHVTSSYSS